MNYQETDFVVAIKGMYASQVLGSLSKSLWLALLQLLLLKRSGESMSGQSAKFKFKQSEIHSSWAKELKVSFI